MKNKSNQAKNEHLEPHHGFIRAFEKHSLAGEAFNHKAHIRMAWYYLNRYPFSEAVERVCRGIKTFDQAVGKGDMYHETITRAACYVIYARIDKNRQERWGFFSDKHPDLLRAFKSVLLQYYSEEHLFSESSKTSFQLPDKLSLPYLNTILP